MSKPDLDNKESIKTFVEAFYEKVLKDSTLAPIFLDVAKIDIEQHFLKIRSYWEKMLLKDPTYKRHMMNIHREVYAKFPFSKPEFDQWVKLFIETVTEHYQGPMAERAIYLANTIAYNMDTVLNKKHDQQTRRPA